MGILPPKKYYIKNIILPGKLIIEKYSDWNCINKYSFESNPIPDQIYVKLPKEKVYVQYTCDFELNHMHLNKKFLLHIIVQ